MTIEECIKLAVNKLKSWKAEETKEYMDLMEIVEDKNKNGRYDEICSKIKDLNINQRNFVRVTINSKIDEDGSAVYISTCALMVSLIAIINQIFNQEIIIFGFTVFISFLTAYIIYIMGKVSKNNQKYKYVLDILDAVEKNS